MKFPSEEKGNIECAVWNVTMQGYKFSINNQEKDERLPIHHSAKAVGKKSVTGVNEMIQYCLLVVESSPRLLLSDFHGNTLAWCSDSRGNRYNTTPERIANGRTSKLFPSAFGRFSLLLSVQPLHLQELHRGHHLAMHRGTTSWQYLVCTYSCSSIQNLVLPVLSIFALIAARNLRPSTSRFFYCSKTMGEKQEEEKLKLKKYKIVGTEQKGMYKIYGFTFMWVVVAPANYIYAAISIEGNCNSLSQSML